MKLIKHMFTKEIGNNDNQFIIVNTLTSFVGILYNEERNILLKWANEDNITPKTEKETLLYDTLSDNQFLVKDDEEEKLIVDKIMALCRNTHANRAGNSQKLVIALTYMCNFSCPYCFEQYHCNEKSGIITKEQVDRIFEIHKGSISSIELFGGEPLLPTTKDIISYIFQKAPNETYCVTTNGYFLNEFLSLFKSVNVARIMVTLDGFRETHNKTRVLVNGEGTYDRIINNIESALADNLHIRIRMNLTGSNREECISLREEFKKKYKKYYEKKLLSFDFHAVMQENESEKTDLYLNSLYSVTKGKEYSIADNVAILSSYPLLKSLILPKYKFNPQYCYCDSEERLYIYDPYGYIYSCPVALGKKEASIGTYYPTYNLKNESMLNRNIESVTECKECINKFLCGGGCANQIIHPGESVLKPNCSDMNAQIDHLIAFAKRELDKQVISAK